MRNYFAGFSARYWNRMFHEAYEGRKSYRTEKHDLKVCLNVCSVSEKRLSKSIMETGTILLIPVYKLLQMVNRGRIVTTWRQVLHG